MSKIEMLRLLINQRLTEAAEEIFGVFGRTIAEYEEEISRSKLEIDRQRRLLDLSLKPRVSLRMSGAAALDEQQEWSSGLLANEASSPHIKEEEVDEWPAQQEEARESPDPDDDKFVMYPGSRPRNEPDGDRTTSKFQDAEDPEPDPRLGPSGQQACLAADCEAPEAPQPTLGNGQPDCVDLEAPLSEVVDSYICTICGRAFAQRGHWAKHVQVHRKVESKADKSYTCDICGKRLTRFDGYQKHLRIHTGEKPYSCSECGRRFSDNSNYKRHIRTHTGQKMQS